MGQNQGCLRRPFLFGLILLIAVFAGFVGVSAYVGDINYDDLINQADLEIITAAFGSNDWSGGSWNPAADLNEDKKINIQFGDSRTQSRLRPHNFHEARLPANNNQNVYKLDACIDGQDRVHVVWSDVLFTDVYYTRLDRFGNTLVDDVLVDHGASTGTDFVAIGCDDAGDAHLIWDCVSSVCEARFDSWGYQVVPKTVVDDRWVVGASEEGGFSSHWAGRTFSIAWARPTGSFMPCSQLRAKAVRIEDPLIYDANESRYRQIAVDEAEMWICSGRKRSGLIACIMPSWVQTLRLPSRPGSLAKRTGMAP